MFNSWSLKVKLIAFSALCSFFLLAVGSAAIFSQRFVVDSYDQIAGGSLPNALAMAKMAGSQKDVVITVMGLVGTNSSDAETKRSNEELEARISKYESAKTEYLSIPFADGEEPLYQALEKNWQAFVEYSRKLVELSGTGMQSDRALRDELAATEYLKLRKACRESLDTLTAFQVTRANEARTAAEKSRSTGESLLITSIVIGFILALGIGYLISRSLSQTLSSLADQLSGGATQVAGAAQQISSTSEQLSSSAAEQASALQETSSSLQEMSSMVERTADNAGKSKTLAGNSHQSATRGQEVVQEMVQAIGEINAANTQIMSAIEASNREFSEIVVVINEIGDKTKVINDIVFQTRLLSFNASVEAARAGEHGKGFAVVAEEVGNLAQMSGNAAKEISALLEGSIQKVEQTVNSTKSKVEGLIALGKEKVESGTEVAKRCGAVLDEIVSGANEVTQMVGEIAHASEEQSKGIHEVNRAVVQMDQTTQQNASASHQAASAAEELSAQAESLRHSVEALLRTVNGSSNNSSTTFATPHRFERKAARSTPPPKISKAMRTVPAATTHNQAPTKASQDEYMSPSELPSENDFRFKDVA